MSIHPIQTVHTVHTERLYKLSLSQSGQSGQSRHPKYIWTAGVSRLPALTQENTVTYIAPSQCESCVPTLTFEDDGDTAERAHETNCPNRKDRTK